jgi:hypothetical protein
VTQDKHCLSLHHGDVHSYFPNTFTSALEGLYGMSVRSTAIARFAEGCLLSDLK